MKFLLNDKGLTINSVHVRHILIFSFLFFFMSSTMLAQEQQIKAPSGNLPLKSDTLQLTADGLKPLDSAVVRKDSIPQKSDIETTINYTARDSIRASMETKMIWLYGDAKIKYGSIELEADEIIIDYANNTLTAHGSRDSLGNRVGYPIFKNGNELYETKDIIYNFKTGRARISEVVTQQGEGYLHADAAFKNERNEILSVRNSYTTCNLEHPHFRIRSTKTKAIPNDKIVSGPFYMEFNDIPLPLGFLFGMFPAQQESTSGILFPSFGEERRRGFNLRGLGYFFDISEYIKLGITTDLYSNGSHAVNITSNYQKRYAYTGGLNFSYSKNINNDKVESPSITKDFRLAWSHSPQSKGTSRFSGSVNAATSTYNQNNNLNYGYQNEYTTGQLSNISTKLSSNVSFSQRFPGTPFNLGVNLSHNQDLVSGQIDLPLPTVSFNMTNIYPFQRKGRTGPMDNLSVSYTLNGTNRITNNLGRLPGASKDSIAPFTMANLPTFIENARKGVRHTIPASFSFKLFRFFTMSPSVNYEEKWYFEKLSWRYVEDENGNYQAKADTIQGFNRISNYSVSAGINTRIYGTYFFKRGKVKAIRHIVNPNVSIGYTPDFSGNPDYFNVIVKPTGPSTVYLPQVTYKSRHEGFVYGGSSLGRSGAVGFGIGNNLEMKVKSEKDSVARKVMLINNLSLGSSYNLMADSFKLAPFSLAANTNVLDNLININLSANLDPYSYQKVILDSETGKSIERRFDTYAWKGGSLGRITSATLAIGSNLNPKAREKQKQSQERIAKSDLPEQEKQFYLQNPNAYVDFDIPWSMNVNFNLSYSHPLNVSPTVTSAISLSGDVSLSENWKVNYNTGYHLQSKEFTQTNITIARDLHCWTMRLTWVPFGRFQSYNFTINVKSSMLKDLKVERRKPFFDSL
ncbi:MAG: LPS-assembly protein LptD [Cyclobacteriaceae bacterium]|nr:LPS-assembly protein LptD [Cyclobacteriaceae bacterium]